MTWRSTRPQRSPARLPERLALMCSSLHCPHLLSARARCEDGAKAASDFDPEVLNLFDQYVHGLIDRRGFLERVARFAVGGLTAPCSSMR